MFGDSGMGKTTLLRTLLLSLVAAHSPDELHAYILDLGGRNFRSFEELPAACRAYVTRIGELCGAPVDVVSVGPDREHTLVRRLPLGGS